MSIRVRHTVAARTSRDTDFKKAMWDHDVSTAEVVTDAFDQGAGGTFSVAAGVGTTKSLSFGDVQVVRGMYLEVNTNCKVRLNGSLDDIEMKISESGKPAKLFLEGLISAVVVENESATDTIEGAACFWGDPTP